MTVYQIKQSVMQRFTAIGFDCDDVNENSIRVYYGGDNLKSYSATISFNISENGYVHMSMCSYDFFNYNEKMYDGLLACNQANEDAAFARFSIDDEGDACACGGTFFKQFDAELAVDFAGIISADIDDAYPFFAKAYWA